jgi:hypothetical protein
MRNQTPDEGFGFRGFAFSRHTVPLPIICRGCRLAAMAERSRPIYQDA